MKKGGEKEGGTEGVTEGRRDGGTKKGKVGRREGTRAKPGNLPVY